jgi:prophage antirepressor-like protein
MNPITVVEETFGSLVSFHYVPETDKFYAHGSQLAKALLFSNPSDALIRNVFTEYRFKIAVGVGQPAWYLSEPGIYQLLFASKHPKAVEFQRLVFEEILPKLRASGYYIMSTATSAQLEAAQAEIQGLQQQLEAKERLSIQSCCPTYLQKMLVILNCGTLKSHERKLIRTIDYHSNSEMYVGWKTKFPPQAKDFDSKCEYLVRNLLFLNGYVDHPAYNAYNRYDHPYCHDSSLENTLEFDFWHDECGEFGGGEDSVAVRLTFAHFYARDAWNNVDLGYLSR